MVLFFSGVRPLVVHTTSVYGVLRLGLMVERARNTSPDVTRARQYLVATATDHIFLALSPAGFWSYDACVVSDRLVSIVSITETNINKKRCFGDCSARENHS